MSRVVVVDVGTTNMKAGIVDPSGKVVREATREMPPQSPEKGAAEHDPTLLVDEFVDLVGQIAEKPGEPIDALGLTGYVFGFCALDGSNRPLTGMMTPLDERPKTVLEEGGGELDYPAIYRRTGCPPLFLYPFAKCRWLKEEKPDLFDRSRRFAGLTSYLSLRLTGRFCTEPSMASATQLYNIHDHRWDGDVLSMAGIDEDQLPEVVPAGNFAGRLRDSMVQRMGLSGEVKLIPGLYDSAAMIVGMGAHEGRRAAVNLGTTTMMRRVSSRPILDDPEKMRLQTYCLFEDRWLVGGGLNNAGIVLRWFRDQCTEGADYDAIVERAAGVKAGSEGLFCLPYWTGERDPRVGERASGVFFGLKPFHTSAHMSRSLMEGVGFTLNLLRTAIEENGPGVDRVRIGGAGTKSNLWPSILADVLNASLRTTTTVDSTLVGVAMLGYVALGVYEDLGAATERMVHPGDRFEPGEERVEIYRRHFSFFQQLVEAVRPLYQRHGARFQAGD